MALKLGFSSVMGDLFFVTDTFTIETYSFLIDHDAEHSVVSVRCLNYFRFVFLVAGAKSHTIYSLTLRGELVG
jgi:hypothetical protein